MRIFRHIIIIISLFVILGSVFSDTTDDLISEAIMLMEEGDYSSAIEILNKYIEEQPDDPAGYYKRGNCYLQLGYFEEAVSDYNETIAIDDTHYKAYNNRGLVYSELGEYQKAIEDFNTTIELNPEEEQVYINRGMVYNEMGDYESALKDLEGYIKELVKMLESEDTWTRGVSKTRLKELGEIAVPYIMNAPDTGDVSVEVDKIRLLASIGDERGIEYLIEKMNAEEATINNNAVSSLKKFGDKVIPYMLDILETEESIEIKGKALYILGDVGGEGVVDELLRFLETCETSLKGDIVYALAEIGDERAMDSIIDLLDGADVRFKCYIIEQLTRFNNERAMEVLFEMLGDENYDVRFRTILSLDKIDVMQQEIASKLIEHYEVEKDFSLKYEVITTLGDIGGEETISFLRNILQNEKDLEKINRASKSLAKIGDPSVIPDLLNLLNHDDYRYRLASIQPLMLFKSEEVINALKERLDDESPEVIYEVAKAFQEIGDTSIIPELLDKLKDDDPEVRACVIYPLTLYETEEAIDAIISVLDDTEPQVVYNAVRSLHQLKETSREVVDKILQNLDTDDGRLASEIVKYLVEFNNERIRQKLVNNLEDENPHIVINSLWVLNEVNFANMEEELLKFLEDERDIVREFSASMLYEFSSERVKQALIEALNDENMKVVMNSARSLSKIGDVSVVPDIIELLDREEPEIRAVAVDVLFNFGTDEAIEALIKAKKVETNEEIKAYIEHLLETEKEEKNK